MQDEQQDILYRAAEVWKELTEYHYVFTYGYKGELHEIKLTFSPEDCNRQISRRMDTHGIIVVERFATFHYY